MALQIKATMDDTQLVAAADRSAKALKGVGEAGKAAGKAVDSAGGGAAKKMEIFGEKIHKGREALNKMALGGLGMLAIGKAGQFASETWSKAADEFKGHET